jgi:hypothetical protein
VRKFQEWVSERWYPEQRMPQIPCVDLEIRDKGNLWRSQYDRAKQAEFGSYVHCAEEIRENELRMTHADDIKTCWCDGRVRIGKQDHWSGWHNNTGWVQCSQRVFGDPWPDVDYDDETGHNP